VKTDPRVDAYLAALPGDQRDQLQALRERVAALAPQAAETFSYAMPAFKIGNRFLLSYAGWKQHCSIYPADEALLERHVATVGAYGRTKGSLHFSARQPLPPALLEELVRERIAAVEADGPSSP
jgi:uncharacterized protein YdhG (YjbR/CyaY superfamily)